MNTSAASLSDLETPAQGSHTTSGTAQPSSPQTKSHESPRAVKLQGSNSGGEQTAVHAHGRKKTPPMRAADGTEIGTDPDFKYVFIPPLVCYFPALLLLPNYRIE